MEFDQTNQNIQEAGQPYAGYVPPPRRGRPQLALSTPVPADDASVGVPIHNAMDRETYCEFHLEAP